MTDIIAYTRVNWGDSHARLYGGRIRGAIESLAERPNLSSRFDNEGKTYLRRRAGSHAVFARIEGDTMIVVRVLHVRMDAKRHLS